jgi:hypothetical protein
LTRTFGAKEWLWLWFNLISITKLRTDPKVTVWQKIRGILGHATMVVRQLRITQDWKEATVT